MKNSLKFLILIFMFLNIIYISFLNIEIYNNTIINLENINSFSFIIFLNKFKKVYCINNKNLLNNNEELNLTSRKINSVNLENNIEDNKNTLNRNVLGSIIGDHGKDIDSDLLYSNINRKLNINKSLLNIDKENIKTLSNYLEEDILNHPEKYLNKTDKDLEKTVNR
jgi:hypothetical protein